MTIVTICIYICIYIYICMYILSSSKYTLYIHILSVYKYIIIYLYTCILWYECKNVLNWRCNLFFVSHGQSKWPWSHAGKHHLRFVVKHAGRLEVTHQELMCIFCTWDVTFIYFYRNSRGSIPSGKCLHKLWNITILYGKINCFYGPFPELCNTLPEGTSCVWSISETAMDRSH